MLKEEIRQLKKNCEDLKRNLSLSLAENEKKSKEDNQLKKDEMKIQTEKAQLIPQINQEEEDLKFKLKQAKTKMDAYFKNSSGLFHTLFKIIKKSAIKLSHSNSNIFHSCELK